MFGICSQYSTELMKSVIRTMATKNVDQYIQWSERGSEFTNDVIHQWTLATICNVCDPNEIVSEVLIYYRNELLTHE